MKWSVYSVCIILSIEEMFEENNVAHNVHRVDIKGTMTKWPVLKQTLKTERKTQNNQTL